MARMLMDAADRGDVCDRDESHRTEQRMRERRQWQREEEMPMADPPEDPLLDASDCQHGCNGDCLIWGDENCSFTCHPYDTLSPRYLAAIRRLERERDVISTEIYARKAAMSRLAADEMTRMAQDWGD